MIHPSFANRAQQAAFALDQPDRLQSRHVLMHPLEVPAEIARERADADGESFVQAAQQFVALRWP